MDPESQGKGILTVFTSLLAQSVICRCGTTQLPTFGLDGSRLGTSSRDKKADKLSKPADDVVWNATGTEGMICAIVKDCDAKERKTDNGRRQGCEKDALVAEDGVGKTRLEGALEGGYVVRHDGSIQAATRVS
ncbi:MAG: hypothetical protein M1818_004520 [Claussenomyces sp. TS43310]|nr:MAG: hypothetical protein M1818_004520 [Claussenomyces sp. TS43310]